MVKLNDLQAVVDTWFDIDGRLQQEQSLAQTKNHLRKAGKIGNLRAQNDRAYFLLIFARFEAYLTQRAKTVIIRRQGSAFWPTRRGWDVLNAGEMSRIRFLHRVSYCLDRQSADFQLVRAHYEIRNALAHEGTTATPFIIPVVAAQLRGIAAKLKS